jgi:Asp/Glu/hydantoin racemase
LSHGTSLPTQTGTYNAGYHGSRSADLVSKFCSSHGADSVSRTAAKPARRDGEPRRSIRGARARAAGFPLSSADRELRCAAQTVRNALEAERAKYDAFVIGHFQEPGLLEVRAALEIPVVGLGEATLLAGCSMGQKLGLVTIDPVFIPWHERQIARQGLAQRAVGVRAIQMDLAQFMRAFTG